jgi:hypothetical protein
MRCISWRCLILLALCLTLHLYRGPWGLFILCIVKEEPKSTHSIFLLNLYSLCTIVEVSPTCAIRPGGGDTGEETVVVAMALQTVAWLVPEVVKALPWADGSGNNRVGAPEELVRSHPREGESWGGLLYPASSGVGRRCRATCRPVGRGPGSLFFFSFFLLFLFCIFKLWIKIQFEQIWNV